MSTLKVGTIADHANGNSAITIDSSGNTSIPSGRVLNAPGHIIQVAQAKFLGNETSNSSSFVDITNLTATLTPAAATSKFLITFNVSANANANQRGGIKVVRKIGSGSFSDFDLQDFSAGSLGGATTSNSARLLAHAIFDGGGSNIPNTPVSMTLLDNPNTTSAVTYKVQGMVEGSSFIYINTFQTFSDANTVFVPISTLTVMEVAG
tara:strand:+ start:555 stop:1175 length:621 start_codon:yes stop_codon:yes gene_type:complete